MRKKLIPLVVFLGIIIAVIALFYYFYTKEPEISMTSQDWKLSVSDDNSIELIYANKQNFVKGESIENVDIIAASSGEYYTSSFRFLDTAIDHVDENGAEYHFEATNINPKCVAIYYNNDLVTSFQGQFDTDFESTCETFDFKNALQATSHKPTTKQTKEIIKKSSSIGMVPVKVSKRDEQDEQNRDANLTISYFEDALRQTDVKTYIESYQQDEWSISLHALDSYTTWSAKSLMVTFTKEKNGFSYTYSTCILQEQRIDDTTEFTKEYKIGFPVEKMGSVITLLDSTYRYYFNKTKDKTISIRYNEHTDYQKLYIDFYYSWYSGDTPQKKQTIVIDDQSLEVIDNYVVIDPMIDVG